MATRSCRVGLHGRNNVNFDEIDYQVIHTANIETIKMMGQTKTTVFKRLKQENPNIEIITRLYDDRFGVNKRPSPQEFAQKQLPIMRALQPYCTKFEVHNEPNHLQGYEGWGQEDYHAQDFNQWFLRVYDLIKNALPWASLGFPGLAIPHRDLQWIEICRPAVERADWLGVHCYWQTPPGQEKNHLVDFWGLRFKYYHEKFPRKTLDITECGNSNIQATPPIAISEDTLARQYAEYYQEIFKYSYLNSASFFLLSSQDPTWDFFTWRSESGRVKPVVQQVRQMSRPTLKPVADITPPIIPPKPPIDIGGEAALPSVQITNIVADLPTHPGNAYPNRPTSAIRQIIIHHTAVSNKVGPQRIAKLQVEKGKPGITYHYFIAWDGTIYQTNKLTTLSDHTQGHNQNSLAIAFAGNFTTEIPNQAQLEAGGNLCAALMLQLNIPLNKVKGATELINTQSPGKQWLSGQKWKILLLNQINRARDLTPITPPITPPSSETEALIALLKAQNAQLRAQLQQMQAAYRQAQQQITLLNRRVAQLEAELAQAKAGIGSDSDEVADLKQRIAVLEFQLSIAQEAAAASAGSSLPSGVAPAVSAPPIKNLADSLPRHPSKHYPTRSISAIKTLVIHHSAVPASISAEQIAQFNVSKNNWPGIGFHYFITQAGDIQQTNNLDTISYHAGGDNSTSVGIAFAGNFNAETPTQSQIDAGGHLVAWLLGHFNLPLSAMKAHKDLTDTPCPGAQWETWKSRLLQTVQSYQSGAGGSAAAPVSGKPTYHYLLYNTANERASAEKYINKFHPAVGTSVEDAMRAQYVTIVANPQSISPQTETQLKANGGQVERVAGNTSQATKALLDNMALTNRRFLTLTEN